MARGPVIFGEPKSGAGRRTLSMPPALVGMLAAHLAARGLTAADEHQVIFAAPAGPCATTTGSGGCGTLLSSPRGARSGFHGIGRTLALSAILLHRLLACSQQGLEGGEDRQPRVLRVLVVGGALDLIICSRIAEPRGHGRICQVR